MGCDKNLVDTEQMLGMLLADGHVYCDDVAAADIIMVNTCCFIEDAKVESIETILGLAEYKISGRARSLIVMGCLAERYKEQIEKEMPEVDVVLGMEASSKIARLLAEMDTDLTGRAKTADCCLSEGRATAARRVLTTGGHYAYLKIAEGCDKHCTYCVIPQIRGPYRSVPMEALLDEAADLVSAGVGELVIVAQETTRYGMDLYGEPRLPALLKALCQIGGLRWVRLLYCYPEEISDELIELLAQEEKICNYLDIPIQHGSDKILKMMGRKTTRQQIVALVEKLRRKIPDICLRTTLMTGFPGETKADHLMNMQLVETLGFDRLGVFCYSAEEGTGAARLPRRVSAAKGRLRRAQLMEAQQKKAFCAARAMKGKRLWVMVEGRVVEGADAGTNLYMARTYKDAPDIDACLYFESEREFMSGDFVEVTVTDARYYDLIGEIP